MMNPDTLFQSLYRGRLGAAILAAAAPLIGLDIAVQQGVPLADQPELVGAVVIGAISAVLSAVSKWREERREAAKREAGE